MNHSENKCRKKGKIINELYNLKERNNTIENKDYIKNKKE